MYRGIKVFRLVIISPYYMVPLTRIKATELKADKR